MSLAALLEATPLPPPLDGDVDVGAACRAMLEARQPIIDSLNGFTVAPDEHPLVAELARRDAAWQTALALAQRVVGDQRISSRKLRAYSDDRQIRRHR